MALWLKYVVAMMSLCLPQIFSGPFDRMAKSAPTCGREFHHQCWRDPWQQFTLDVCNLLSSYPGWWWLEHGWIIFPYVGNSHPNWLSYFSEGLKPPTSIIAIPDIPFVMEEFPGFSDVRIWVSEGDEPLVQRAWHGCFHGRSRWRMGVRAAYNLLRILRRGLTLPGRKFIWIVDDSWIVGFPSLRNLQSTVS